jgi:hypothetical protein
MTDFTDPDSSWADPATTALAVLAELAGIPEDDWLDGPVSDVGLRYHRLLAVERLVHSLCESLQLQLVDSMDSDLVGFPGGRLVRTEVNSSAWKTKDSGKQLRDDLTRAVADNIALDVATGDMDPIKRNVARATMLLALEAIPSFSNLNKAGRERLGLQMSYYRDYGTTYKVTVEALDD